MAERKEILIGFDEKYMVDDSFIRLLWKVYLGIRCFMNTKTTKGATEKQKYIP